MPTPTGHQVGYRTSAGPPVRSKEAASCRGAPAVDDASGAGGGATRGPCVACPAAAQSSAGDHVPNTNPQHSLGRGSLSCAASGPATASTSTLSTLSTLTTSSTFSHGCIVFANRRPVY